MADAACVVDNWANRRAAAVMLETTGRKRCRTNVRALNSFLAIRGSRHHNVGSAVDMLKIALSK
jgi:hypothetical protein